jgi:hypothetical protein
MKTAETIGGVLDHEFIAEHTNGFVKRAGFGCGLLSRSQQPLSARVP